MAVRPSEVQMYSRDMGEVLARGGWAFHIHSREMGEVLARGDGRSIFTRVRWGRCWPWEDGRAAVPCADVLERYGGGVGERRWAFHISSSEMGEVLARGEWPSGLLMCARARCLLSCC